jgi:hypothetical protein
MQNTLHFYCLLFKNQYINVSLRKFHVFPKSFFRGDCGLDSKSSLKKRCRSVCASDRADQMRGKVAFGEDAGSTRV